jgi:hypothetical protein
MIAPEYYGKDGTLTVFNKYYLDESEHIVSKKTNKRLSYVQNKRGYYSCSLVDNTGKCRMIRIARMKVSTFCGKPPSLEHSADHTNRVSNDDRKENIKWATLSEQKNNRVMPETLKSSLIIVRYGIEKTAKEWSEYLKDQKNSFGRVYTESMIRNYAQKNQFEFGYKKYTNLQGELWKEITGSNNGKGGRWEISNMNRVKYITKYAENVISGERFGLDNGYPTICINGKNWGCHTLAFMTFFPNVYAAKKQDEIVKHVGDNKTDFRPHMLQIGTKSENQIEAYENGCYDETNVARLKCASFINGVFEKEHESQRSAEKYLKSLGTTKACQSAISRALSSFENGKVIKRYGRTWKLVD